jgi:DNA processing protein
MKRPMTCPVSVAHPSVRQVWAHESEFPRALAVSRRPARCLWYRGRLPDPAQPALAIVGARAATRAGCRLAADLSRAAVERGYAIVSGGALGIDAAPHRGALDARGVTFAFLGCGVDVVYPDRHVALFEEIAAHGGLISEHPPGTPPRGKQFPSRNRLVVGLAQAVLVVEAKPQSGALVTARLAIELGRPLLAVPGSVGTDDLIFAGKARSVTDAADLLRALAGQPAIVRTPPAALAPLVTLLARGDAAANEIARQLRLPLPAALALVAEAELDGWVKRFPGGRIGTSIKEPRAS